MNKIKKLVLVVTLMIVALMLFQPKEAKAFIGRVVDVKSINELVVTSGKEMYIVKLDKVNPNIDFTISYSPNNYGHGIWWVDRWIKHKNVRVNVVKNIKSEKDCTNVIATVYLHSGCNDEEWSMRYYRRGTSLNRNIMHQAKQQVKFYGTATWDY